MSYKQIELKIPCRSDFEHIQRAARLNWLGLSILIRLADIYEQTQVKIADEFAQDVNAHDF